MAMQFELREQDGRLELAAHHHPAYRPIWADWTGAGMHSRLAGGKKQLLARAVGLPKNPGLSLLDGTAGLGRDGYLLAFLGARVTMAERNPTVAALLRDAHRRALLDPAAAAAAARIEIVEADGRSLCTPALPPRFDVVYLDPMYPDRGKTALAGRELQILRELTGGDPDAGELLAAANAGKRVVVKRPVKAPPLAGRAPSLALTGTQARFDIYLMG
jgi:16S rRNA (guanine1516-N2)-methyltransferase